MTSETLFRAIASGLGVGVIYLIYERVLKKKKGYLGFKQCPDCGYPLNLWLQRTCTMCRHSLKVNSSNPSFETRVAQAIGKTIIVGLTYKDDKGAILERKQIHGKIIQIDPEGPPGIKES
jgi:hypothetical protein